MDERFRRGFMPQGINQHPGYAPDIKESYEYALDLPLDDPGRRRRPAAARAEPLAARTCRGCASAAEAYFDETLALGKRLLRVFAVSLDLERAFSFSS